MLSYQLTKFIFLLLHRLSSAFITVAAFLLGALCSGIAGYVGMWVSVRANVRVSSAARRSAREALQVFCNLCAKPSNITKLLIVRTKIASKFLEVASIPAQHRISRAKE